MEIALENLYGTASARAAPEEICARDNRIGVTAPYVNVHRKHVIRLFLKAVFHLITPNSTSTGCYPASNADRKLRSAAEFLQPPFTSFHAHIPVFLNIHRRLFWLSTHEFRRFYSAIRSN